MEVNNFTVRMMLLGLPGIIAYFVSDKIVIRRWRDVLPTVLTIFAYAVLSYILLALVTYVAGDKHDNGVFAEVFGSQAIGFRTILGGIVCGLVLALASGYAFRFSILNRAAKAMGATKRFGDTDVWHYFNNSPMDEKNDGYLYVRDHKRDLIYYGYISLYSDSGEERELVLTDVSVYENGTGEYCYSVQHMYLSRTRDDLTIEVPMPADQRVEVSQGGANDRRTEQEQTCPSVGRTREASRPEPATPEAKT